MDGYGDFEEILDKQSLFDRTNPMTMNLFNEVVRLD